jgi:hypothetical protein
MEVLFQATSTVEHVAKGVHMELSIKSIISYRRLAFHDGKKTSSRHIDCAPRLTIK